MAKSKSVTIADVARLAEVSMGTVSRVVNRDPTVRPVTRKAVMAAVDRLGYRPNFNARNLRLRQTQTIGLLMGNLTQALVPLAIRGIERALRPHGYALIISDGASDEDVEQEALSTLLDRRVDGILWMPHIRRSAAEARVTPGAPPVVFFGQASPSESVPTAMVEESAALEEMARDLLALGHTELSYIGVGPAAHGRLRRLHPILNELGMACPPNRQLLLSRDEDTYEAVARLLHADPRPTALLFGPHGLVPWALRAIRDAGLQLPRDLSLVAFGETDWAEVLNPSLSVIGVDYLTHAQDAAGMLLRHIDGDDDAPRVIRHRSEYIRRESAGPAPALQA